MACGVCRTDLHIVEGDLPPIRPRIVPGHQIVGEVVAGAIPGLPLGTRAGVSWMGGVDGDCWFCSHDMENLCDHPVFTGYSVNGGYAEYASVRADFAIPLPAGLDDSHVAPLLCAGIITFAPSGKVVVSALSALRKGGVVAINAIHLDQMPAFDYDKLLWGERQIRSVANMTRQDARDFLALAKDLNFRPRVVPFSLEDSNKALEAVKHETEDGSAVIVL